MNIGIISSTASYHQLVQMLLKEGHTVYHYGASSTAEKANNYHPYHADIPVSKPLEINKYIPKILEKIKENNHDFVMASGIPVPMSREMHSGLKEINVPYFFVSPEMTSLENNKTLSKKLLTFLEIPTGVGEEITGEELFNRFKDISRPFVVKLNFLYHFGKQTIVVTDDNWEEAYMDLFSVRLNELPRPTNINFNAKLILEDYIDIKREYSYHALMNSTSWQYLGSARDYKKSEDGDKGFNCVSMGSYNVTDIDDVVHTYVDKIFRYFKEKGYVYKGFLFLGIAIDKNNIPYVLEINTRSGDPELQVILGSVENNLGDLFYAASTDKTIPKVKHNKNKVVTIRLVNSVYDWTTPGSFLPKLQPAPDDVLVGIEGNPKFFIKHSVFTSTDKTHKAASKKIYNYLDKQNVGQYRYRRDIGILK